jgi:aspartyl-tRNA(Asn)/glutamyl-tRNA(Gln) amidotransferase subunit A
MNAYLASYPAAQKNYRDICESDRTRVWGNTKECLKFVANLPPKFGTKYNDTLKVFKKNKIYVEKIMDKYHLDALLIPVSTTGSATYNVKAIMNEFVASNAGVPGITFPIGYTKADHMPVGVELIGRQFAEGTLLGMAYAYEKNSPPRVPPTMPEPNLALEKMDIPSYNNLLIKMGFDAYQTILIKSKPGEFSKDLTPDKFRKIVSEELNRVDDKN